MEKQIISPDVDIIEKNDAVVLFADLPGVQDKDLDITFDKGVLRLQAKRLVAAPKGFGTDAVAKEDHFERSFGVSKDIDPESFSAQLKDGVLTLTMRKAKQLQPKKIAVHSN